MLLCAESELSFAAGSAVPELGAGAQLEAQAEAPAEAQAEAQAGAEAQAEAQAEAGVEAEAVAVAEAGVEADAAAVALLTRVATESPWCEIVASALGSDFTWQAWPLPPYLLLRTLLTTTGFTWQARPTHLRPTHYLCTYYYVP